MLAERVGAALLFALVVAGRSALPQTPAAAAGSPVTYTEEQAGRGGEVFTRVCVECHTRKDMSSPDFRVKWNGRSAFDLFERIRSTMPESDPGAMPRAEYLNVTAYLVKLNGIPAGAVELPEDEAALRKQLLTLPSHF